MTVLLSSFPVGPINVDGHSHSPIVESLCSGSSGNALLVRANGATLLFDAGLGPRLLRSAILERSGRTLPDALFLTHEHADHVRSLPMLRKHDVPIHATAGTAAGAGLGTKEFRRLVDDSVVEIAGGTVRAIGVSHDANEPCGFAIEIAGTRIVLLTDLGVAPASLVAWLAAADVIVLEANHDVGMLTLGPYPAHLKRRVLSDRGHLSNEDCASALRRALANERRPRDIWLAHLSTTNNRPDVAVATVDAALRSSSVRHRVAALPRFTSGPRWAADVAPSAQLRLFGDV